jgi:hypothetical protein
MSPSPCARRQSWSTALLVLCRVSHPLTQTCVTLSTTPRLSPPLPRVRAPEPSSFLQGGHIVSITSTLEQSQPPILLVQSNTREIPPHTKPMVPVSGHALGPLSSKVRTFLSGPLLRPTRHSPSVLHPSETRQPLVPSLFDHQSRSTSRLRRLRPPHHSNRLPRRLRVH